MQLLCSSYGMMVMQAYCYVNEKDVMFYIKIPVDVFAYTMYLLNRNSLLVTVKR
jgi:hypothetical protein